MAFASIFVNDATRDCRTYLAGPCECSTDFQVSWSCERMRLNHIEMGGYGLGLQITVRFSLRFARRLWIHSAVLGRRVSGNLF